MSPETLRIIAGVLFVIAVVIIVVRHKRMSTGRRKAA